MKKKNLKTTSRQASVLRAPTDPQKGINLSCDNSATSEVLEGSRPFSHYGTRPRKVGTATLTERQNRRGKNAWAISRYILTDIETILRIRSEDGPILSDDGEWIFPIALPFIVKEARLAGRAVNSELWARRWTPLVAVGHSLEWFRQAEEEAGRAKWPSVDEISQKLRIKPQEAERVDLYSLSSYDRTEEVRQQDRKENDRLRKERKRRTDGRPARDQWLANTKATTAVKHALAKEHGVSRQTINNWIRKGKIEFPVVSATLINNTGMRTHLETPKAVVVDAQALTLNDNDNMTPDLKPRKYTNFKASGPTLRHWAKVFPKIAGTLHGHLAEIDVLMNDVKPSQRRDFLSTELKRRNAEAGGVKVFKTATRIKQVALPILRKAA